LRMKKVIKGEFEKLEDLKLKDVSLTCDTSLDVFNNEINRLSGMDDDLFVYKVEVANILCDSNKDDDSEHECRMKLMIIWDMTHLMLHLLNGWGQKILTDGSLYKESIMDLLD
ncbi:hypothetical protein Tco_1521816, partial [Tanacetum coccineum]